MPKPDLDDLIECREMLIQLIEKAEKLSLAKSPEFQTIRDGLKGVEELIASFPQRTNN